MRAPPVGSGAALAALAIAYLALAVTSLHGKSITVDEPGHLAAGHDYLRTFDSVYASLNPPLVNVLSALPVRLSGAAPVGPSAPRPAPGAAAFWSGGLRFLEAHRAEAVRLFTRARYVTVALVLALGVGLYLWGRALAPAAPELAGLLAAGCVWLSPNVLAHARLVTTDAGAAVFATAAHAALFLLLRRPTRGRALACGVALGAALLAKHYALLLLPVFAGVAGVAAWRRPAAERRRIGLGLLGAFAVGWGVLCLGYGLQGVGAPAGAYTISSERLEGLFAALPEALPIPLPAAYVVGLDQQAQEVEVPRPERLRGEVFTGGRPDYFLVLLGLKTPLALLALALGGAALALRRRLFDAEEAALLLGFPALLLAVLSLSSDQQLGLRSLLAGAPLVWLAVAVAWARARPGRPGRIVLAGLAAAAAIATLRIHPDYLASFNVLAGGPASGHLQASGSNLDWGQDLPALARFAEARPDEGPLQLLYFGTVDPSLYGLEYVVPRRRLVPGWLAISTNFYTQAYPVPDHGRFRVMGPVPRERLPFGPPVATPGHSIHVHRIGPEAAASYRLPRPSPLSAGPRSDSAR